MRNDADGLTALSAVAASSIAGGGVLPRVLFLKALADGERDVDARDGTFAVATLDPDEVSTVLSTPDTTDGTNTALPNSSSEIASSGASSVLPSSSTVGRATARSRLSESPNFAVEPEGAPESVIAPATARGALRLTTCRWSDDGLRHQPTLSFSLCTTKSKTLCTVQVASSRQLLS